MYWYLVLYLLLYTWVQFLFLPLLYFFDPIQTHVLFVYQAEPT